MRKCKHCEITEDIINFWDRKYQGRIQKLSICLPCYKEIRSLQYEKNRLTIIQKAKEWIKNNRDRHNSNERNRRIRNRIKYNEYQVLYRSRNSK